MEIDFNLGRYARFPATFLIGLDEFHQDAEAQRIAGGRNQRADVRLGGTPPGFLQLPDRYVDGLPVRIAQTFVAAISPGYGGVVSFVFIASPC